ncbi:hypothetical protein [Tahibacter caeni]|nr:hypothetical protein [Tahibacter caeni]
MSNNLVVLGWPSLTADTGGGAVVYPCDAIFAHGIESNAATRVCALP